MSGILSLFRSKKQVFSYEFTIKRLELNFSKGAKIGFTLKGKSYLGNEKVESQKYAYYPSSRNIDVNEILAMTHTLYNEKKGSYKPKFIKIIITAFFHNTKQRICRLDLNLSDYIDSSCKDNVFSLKDIDGNAKL